MHCGTYYCAVVHCGTGNSVTVHSGTDWKHGVSFRNLFVICGWFCYLEVHVNEIHMNCFAPTKSVCMEGKTLTCYKCWTVGWSVLFWCVWAEGIVTFELLLCCHSLMNIVNWTFYLFIGPNAKNSRSIIFENVVPNRKRLDVVCTVMIGLCGLCSPDICNFIIKMYQS